MIFSDKIWRKKEEENGERKGEFWKNVTIILSQKCELKKMN